MSEPESMNEQTGLLLTPEGHDALQKELEHLTMVKRPEIADRIRESQQHGEFSEDNNELDEVKFEQALVAERIATLKHIFGTAHVLDPKRIPTDHVGIGSRVKVLDIEFADEFEVRVVTSVEADPQNMLISTESPMGTALFGKSVKDDIEFEAPDGVKQYKILSIRR